jgi:hypothetical protein
VRSCLIDGEAIVCEDWSLMVGYVQACVEKLPGELEEWQKDLFFWSRIPKALGYGHWEAGFLA